MKAPGVLAEYPDMFAVVIILLLTGKLLSQISQIYLNLFMFKQITNKYVWIFCRFVGVWGEGVRYGQ